MHRCFACSHGCFESLQRGYAAQPFNFLQGYFRGMATLQVGADRNAQQLGIQPSASQQGNFDLNCASVSFGQRVRTKSITKLRT